MKGYHYIIGILGTILLGGLPPYFVGTPTVLFPMPIYIVLTTVAKLHILCCLFIFVICSSLVFNKDVHVFKKRATIINLLITVSTSAWFLIGKDYGLKYQGVNHFLAVLLLNGVSVAILWWLSYKPESRKMFIYSLALPFFLVWLGFPYLGELL